MLLLKITWNYKYACCRQNIYRWKDCDATGMLWKTDGGIIPEKS